MGDMSKDPPKRADDVEIPEELFAQLSEVDRKQRAAQLTQDIANKYDPSTMSKMVVESAGRGEALDYATRVEMERRLRGNFGNVRVFRGAFADSMTKAHGADAVTVANTGMIMMGSGRRSDPKTALGKSLLAHELTHVSQAQQGLHFALEGGQGQAAPHEQEAEAVESAVHAEATGAKGGGDGGKGGDKDKKEKKIIERVIELVREHDLVRRERLGHD